jgi:DNA-binding LacI/PurR family transcriptional regulator
MNKKPYEEDFSDRALLHFVESGYRVGDAFWSGRQLGQIFGVSKYAAFKATADLIHRGFLKASSPKARPRLARLPLKWPAQPRIVRKPTLGVLWPGWATPDNRFTSALQGALDVEFRRRQWNHVSFKGDLWNRHDLKQLILSKGCSAILTIDPPWQAMILFSELRALRVPILNFGARNPILDFLSIPTIEGRDDEAARMLTLQMRHRGVTQFAVVGFAPATSNEMRLKGYSDALEQYDHDFPADWLIESHAGAYTLQTLAKRLAGTNPPRCIVFQEFATFEKALVAIPELRPQIAEKKIFAAIFDEASTAEDHPGLPIISLQVKIPDVAKVIACLLERLFAHKKIPLHNKVTRHIVWHQ